MIKEKCTLLEDVIPEGPYCYTRNDGVFTICPHWRKFYDEYPDQDTGYCTYLKLGDFMEEGTMLLWDQVKECGINEWDEEEL